MTYKHQAPTVLSCGFSGSKHKEINHLLAKATYQEISSTTLVEAYGYLNTGLFPLVLLDWSVLPENNLDKTYQQVKSHSEKHTIPVLVVVENRQQLLAAMQAGYADCVLNTQWPKAMQSKLSKYLRLADGIRVLHRNLAKCVQQKKRAEAANKSKTHFLATASHDLRQPLHSLELLLEVLENRLSNDLRNLEIVQQIRASTTGLRNLLDTLLDISKLDAGMVKPVKKVLRLKRIIAEVCQELLPQALNKNLLLTYYSCEFLIKSDEQILKRILRNLLHNAVRYTDSGRVIVGARQQGDKVEIQVWDTGIGIAAPDQQRVFEEFFQLGNMEKNGADGMGLGLASVQKMADLLGYSISLKSKPGKGSMFAVRLPLIPTNG